MDHLLINLSGTTLSTQRRKPSDYVYKNDTLNPSLVVKGSIVRTKSHYRDFISLPHLALIETLIKDGRRGLRIVNRMKIYGQRGEKSTNSNWFNKSGEIRS